MKNMINIARKRCLSKNIDELEEVYDYAKVIQIKNTNTWIDKYGSTKISFGPYLISNLIKKWNQKGTKYIICLSPLVRRYLGIEKAKIRFIGKYSRNIKWILSIGGAREHNSAKEYLFSTDKSCSTKLVTAPAPLSNDSFGTNLSSPCFGNVIVPSRQSAYPAQILIDSSILEDMREEFNISGVGEVMGLYYSLKDYFAVRKLSPTRDLLLKIERSVQNLAIKLKTKDAIWLKLLAIALIEKCLFMRIISDNQIIAGGDHLIAYAIDYCSMNREYEHFSKLSHGEKVYWGSIVMAALFPEWEYGFFSLKKLIAFGFEIGIIEHKTYGLLEKCLKNGLIELAIKMRPNRLTILSSISQRRIQKSCDEIYECINAT